MMFTMSVSSTFTSAVTIDISAIVMMVLAAAFCTPGTTVSPMRTGRYVTSPSMGAATLCFLRMSFTRVRPACVCAMRRCDPESWRFQLRQLRARLHDPRIGLSHCRLLAVECRFPLLEIGFRNQPCLKQFLASLDNRAR